MVREFLNGRFENTAFCILAPDGKKRLSGTGRSPMMGLRVRGRPEPGTAESKANNGKTIAKMDEIAAKYPAKGTSEKAVVQNFHSFKQALNIASGDQRLLVFVVAPQKDRSGLKRSMQAVANHPDVMGRFHFDFADKVDVDWSQVIDGDKNKTGIFIIQAGKFGQHGKAVAELPLNTQPEKIRSTLNQENQKFAKNEKRKVYSDHVVEGRREGVKYVDNMPWGEDRDADGKIDERRRRR